MNRILIAAVAALGFAGAAIAQEAPQYIGNYGPAVENALTDTDTVRQPEQNVDRTTTASVPTAREGGNGPIVIEFDIRSGR